MSLNSTDIKTFWGAFEKDPLFFGRKMFPKMFYTGESPSFHGIIADAIRNPAEESTVIVVARKRAKSTISTFLMPIWLAFFMGYRYICIASLAGDRAKDFLENIKDAITDPNGNFYKTFGDVCGGKWSASQIDISYQNEELGLDVDCRIRSLGKGMQFAGAIHKDVRPELIIFDDVEDDDTVENEAVVRKMMTKIDDAILPSLDERRGHFVMIGTPYGHDSALKRMYERKYRVRKIRIPAIVEDNQKRDGYKLSELLGVPVGKSIWESQFPTKKVWKEREDWAGNGVLASWQAQKMCYFNAQVGYHRFYEEDINEYELRDIDSTQMNLFMLIDAAYKKKKTNDPAGLILVGVNDDGDFYVLEAEEGKYGGIDTTATGSPNKNYDVELARKAVDVAKLYVDSGHSINTMGIESNAYDFLYPLFMQEMEKQSCVVPMEELMHRNQPKENRIRELTPFCKMGRIHIRKEHTELRAQMIRFDASQEQDGLHILDAFAYLPKIYYKPNHEQQSGCGSDLNKQLWEIAIQNVRDRRTAAWDRSERIAPSYLRRGLA